MKRIFITIGLALMLGASAQAQTPKEVLTSYKAYRTALKEKNRRLATEKAYEAWQLAEDLMGDSPTTGDLAANFAELQPRYMGRKESWKRVVNAHKRAIDLAALAPEEAQSIEIERREKYISYLMANIQRGNQRAWHKDYGTDRMKARIKEFGLQGSTFDAESLALSSRFALMNSKWSDAEAESKAAIQMFESRTDGLPSAYEYAAPIYLARAYAGQKRPVEAALTYQELMTKLEVKGGHKNAISSDAYGHWLRLRDEIIDKKNTDPRAAKVVNFVVPAGRADELSPLLRRPPEIPRSFLSGNKSGFVNVKFDVDADGHVVNPIITSSTNSSLHHATLESLKGWRYSPNIPTAKARDVETTVRFNIQSETGTLLPDGIEVNR